MATRPSELAEEAGPARDLAGLRALILDRRRALPRRLSQVAGYALDHPEEMAFGTAASLAAAAGVQPSTLVRLAQALGYQGFSDMQAVFRDHLRGQWPEYRDRLASLRTGDAAGSLLQGFARAAIGSIERLTASLPPERMDAAIALLAQADTIYLVAARRAFPVASYLAYLLGRLGLKRVLVDHAALMGPETLDQAGGRDVVVALSFTPYTSLTVELAAQAQRRGAPVLAITDSSFSPLVPLASAWLEVAEASHAGFRSLAATQTLAMALAAGAAEARSASVRA
jgi:DNA-binding MurR/RpiR family transcriptional regulator